MSEPLDDRTLDRLDRLIDESARSLTAAEAAPDLRARVFSRLHEDADRGWKARWLVPGMAIASACVAAIAIYVGSDFSRSSDSQTSSIRLKPDPTTASVPKVGSDFSRSNESSIRLKPDATNERSTTETSAVVQSEPPPGFESIGAAELTIDALGVAGLAAPAAISVESIPLETIEIAALGTE